MRARVLLWALNAPENSSFAPFLAPQLTIPRVWREGVDNYSLSSLYTERGGEGREGVIRERKHARLCGNKTSVENDKGKECPAESGAFFSLPPSRVFKCRCFRSVQMHACMHAWMHTYTHACPPFSRNCPECCFRTYSYTLSRANSLFIVPFCTGKFLYELIQRFIF